jgi:RimJ/RimL family protein N-acetyltransferase
MDKIPGPAYRVHTRRLVIRCWHPRDAALMKKAVDASLEHLKPWMPWAHDEAEDLEKKIARLREFRGKFDLGQDYVYAIFNQDETEVLGGTGLHTRAGQGAREIGYWIHQDYVNQGLATESTAALVRVAFEIDQVQRVIIHCNPENVRSAAIPARLGFTHEAILKQRMLFLDRLKDEMIWTLFSEDYPGSPAAQAELQAYDAAGRQIL